MKLSLIQKNYLLSGYRIILQVFACCVAYTCNKGPKK